MCRRVRYHCFRLLSPPHTHPMHSQAPPSRHMAQTPHTHMRHHILPNSANLGWSINVHRLDQIPRFCWSVHPDGPCALSSACTWSLSPDNLFSHIPWPITGQGSCGLARWAEIVFLCTRLAEITLITLTAVTRTP